MPGGPVASAERIIAFHETKGTLPRVTAAPDSVEEGLYRTLKRMRVLHRQGKFDVDATRLLNSACPGWAAGRAFGSDRLWQQRRDDFVKWVASEGRLPHPSSGDETERSLASFVAAYRKHALHSRHPGRIRELDELVPGWSGTPEWMPKA